MSWILIVAPLAQHGRKLRPAIIGHFIARYPAAHVYYVASTQLARLVHTVRSLDIWRIPLSSTKHPRIFSICCIDQPKDNGVIPSLEEQAKFGIRFSPLPAQIAALLGSEQLSAPIAWAQYGLRNK